MGPDLPQMPNSSPPDDVLAEVSRYLNSITPDAYQQLVEQSLLSAAASEFGPDPIRAYQLKSDPPSSTETK